jgi:hypothetical protein
VDAQLASDSKIVGIYYSVASTFEISDIYDKISKQISENSGIRVVVIRIYLDKKGDNSTLEYDIKLGP